MADEPTLDIYLTITSVQQASYSLKVILKPSDDSIVITETKKAICDHILACIKESHLGYDSFDDTFRKIIGKDGNEILDDNRHLLTQVNGPGKIWIDYDIDSLSNDFSLGFRTQDYLPNTDKLELFLSLKGIQYALAETIREERQEDKRVPFVKYTVQYGNPIEDTVFTVEKTDVELPQVTSDAITLPDQRTTVVALEPELEEEVHHKDTTKPLDPFYISPEQRNLARGNGKKTPTATNLEPLSLEDLAEEAIPYKTPQTAVNLEPLRDLAADDGKTRENDTSSLRRI